MLQPDQLECVASDVKNEVTQSRVISVDDLPFIVIAFFDGCRLHISTDLIARVTGRPASNHIQWCIDNKWFAPTAHVGCLVPGSACRASAEAICISYMPEGVLMKGMI